MAYEDIIPDIDNYPNYTIITRADFNGNFNTYGAISLNSDNTPYATYTKSVPTLPHPYAAFVNEHPFDNSKQSWKVTTVSGGNTLSTSIDEATHSGVDNNHKLMSTKHTVEVWIKYTLSTAGNVPSLGSFYSQNYYDLTYGDVSAFSLELIGGGVYGTGDNGVLRVSYRNSTTQSIRTGRFYVSPNEWHCIHLEFHNDGGLVKNRPYFYLDGVLDNCASTAVTSPPLASRQGIRSLRIGIADAQIPSSNQSGATFNIAEARVFSRNLTKEEKMLRANYGKRITSGLVNTILTDGAVMLLNADNETQYPVTLQGSKATEWGNELLSTWTTGQTTGRITYGTKFYVNQTGNRNKAWRFDLSSDGQGRAAILGNTAQKFKELWHDNTKSISFEWYSTSPLYDGNVTTNPNWNFLSLAGGAAGTAGQGKLIVSGPADNNSSTSSAFLGMMTMPSLDYWNGTSWVTAAISGGNFVAGVSANAQINYSNHADGNWHQHVITIDRSTNAIIATYYFDGVGIMTRNYGANSNQAYVDTNNWATLDTRFRFGYLAQPSTTTARSVSFDNFAVYDVALTAEQVRQHFYAFCAEDPLPGGIVRYWNGTAWVDSSAQKVWNGTAWIDWDHKYWNGTQWISL